MTIRSFPRAFGPLFLGFGLVTLFALPARAADEVQATVPFAFTAGEATLPAGQYLMTIDRDDGVLKIQDLKSDRTEVVQFVSTLERIARPDLGEARVEFAQTSNGTYTLSRVWLPDAEGVRVEEGRGMMAAPILSAMK